MKLWILCFLWLLSLLLQLLVKFIGSPNFVLRASSLSYLHTIVSLVAMATIVVVILMLLLPNDYRD